MEGRFPVPLAPDDFRFGFALTFEVAKLLAAYGYPNILSFYDGAVADFDRLQHLLFRFLYTDPPAVLTGTSQADPSSLPRDHHDTDTREASR